MTRRIELVDKIFVVLKSKIKVIIVISIIFAGFVGLLNKYFNHAQYEATYELFIEKENIGMSAAMRLASSFGLSSGNNSKSYEILKYLTSRSNLEKCLTSKSSEGKNILEYFIKNDDIQSRESLRKVMSGTNRYKDSLITHTIDILNKKNLQTNYDKKNETINVTLKTQSEILTLDFLNLIIKNTEDYFITEKFQRDDNMSRSFQMKVDSLAKEIEGTLIALAEYKDMNFSLISEKDKVTESRLRIKLQGQQVAYAEYLKALELIKVDMIRSAAPFMYFDTPVLPFEKKKMSSALVSILAFIGSTMVSTFWVLRGIFISELRLFSNQLIYGKLEV